MHPKQKLNNLLMIHLRAKKLELRNKTGIPFKNLYSYMIETFKEKRNIKKLGNKTSKVIKKIKCIKKLGNAAALMYKPPLNQSMSYL